MTYTTNIPVSGDSLGGTRDRIRTNFQTIESTFNVNHVPFGTVGGEGKHNVVTTPIIIGSTHPSTLANEPKFYALSEGNLGTIQYSRGPSNAVPTPVTALQSPSSFIAMNPGDITNVFNFTGLTRAMGMLYAFDQLSSNHIAAFVWWDGSIVQFDNFSTHIGAATLNPHIPAVDTIAIRCTGAPKQVFWTFDLKRVS